MGCCLPSFHHICWLSAPLTLPHAADHLHGTLGGFAGENTADKVFGVFNALGTVAFAYNFATVLLEIQVSWQ